MTEQTENPSALKCSAAEAMDKEYRKGSRWHAFMGSLYTAFAGAAFFGVLDNLLGVGMKILGPTAGADAGMTIGNTLLMAGAMAAGAICTWLAQSEFTELKCIQDERLARKNAEMMGRKPLMELQPEAPSQPEPAATQKVDAPVPNRPFGKNAPSPVIQVIVVQPSATASVQPAQS